MQLNAACLQSGGKAALEGNGVKTSPLFFLLSFTVMDDKNVTKLNELIQQG